MSKFPKNFFWGGATSAYQIEGGLNEGGRGASHIDNNRFVPKEDRKHWAIDVTLDEYLASKNNPEDFDLPHHRGSDFYFRYKEDIKLMAEMGFKMYRMSISWTRLFPTGLEEKPNKEGVEFYHNVFRELRKYKIEPLVTMIHYEVPAYLTETINGWESEDMIKYFTHYSKFLIDEYKNEVTYWITFNEINMVGNSLFLATGMFAEKVKNDVASAAQQALHYQFIASAITVKFAHDTAPHCKIGNMVARLQNYPYTCKPEDVFATMQDNQINMFYHDVMVKGFYPKSILNFYKNQNIEIQFVKDYESILRHGTVDFISFSYYFTSVISTDEDKKEPLGTFVRNLKNPYHKLTDWGWGIDPLGLRITLNELNDKYGLPMIIAENGIGALDKLNNGKIHDPYRIDYMRQHIEAISDAIQDGCNVIGYTPWGCIDLVSCGTAERSKRYGLVYVDADDYSKGTFNRFPKDSFYWYKKVIGSNGERLD